MATIEQLSAALIKADAAGNTADAKALADEIRRVRAAPAAPELPESLRPRTEAEIPGPRQELTRGQQVYQAARPFVAPLVEAGGAIAGGLVGTPMGPAGIVGGAGLGYGIAKEGLEMADVAMGMKPRRQGIAQVAEPVRNVLEGATFEAGGRVAGPLIAKGVGKLVDLRQIPKNRTANIARTALGPDLDQAVNALRNAPPGASVAEVTANIQNPAWQALIRDGLEKTPQGAQYLNKFATLTQEEGVNVLSKLAGGATAADVRATTEGAKKAVSSITTPMRESALKRADLGKEVARLEGAAVELGEQAAAKVEDVRRLTRLAAQAEVSAAKTPVRTASGERVGMPLMPGRYTYAADLAKKAEGWATQAAGGSLDAGLAARQSKGAADALRNVGIEPLDANLIVTRMRSAIKDPQLAGIREIEKAVDNFSVDVKKWTDVDGIIPASALDALRKNSVNSAINEIMPSASDVAKKAAAAKVLTRVRPIIDDAIESAGGAGYRDYLKQHAQMSQKVAEKELTGEALRLFKNDKDAFVRLVQNESPDVVEKILGPGKYNIAAELSENTLSVLQAQAERRINQLAASKQATDGEKALTTLLRENTSRFRLPSWLSFWGAAANKTLSELEKAIGGTSMKVLSTAAQSPQRTANLLESLPAAERNRVLQLLADPVKWGAPTRAAVTGTTTMGVNMLAPDRNVENAFVR
jgi:hypothetical protein